MIESALRAGGRQFEYSEIRKNGLSRWDKPFFGAAGQIRTADLVITNDALYRLSYSSMAVSNSFIIIAWIGKMSSLFSRLFFQFRAYYIPYRDQTVECPCSVGGAGGGESCCGDAGGILLIFLIEAQRCAAVAEDGGDWSISEKAAEIGRDDIADAAVAGAGDLTAGDHIPDRDVMREQHIAFFINRRRDWAAEHCR